MRAMIGAMREQLVVQTSAPLARSVSSLTRSATTATATTAAAHGYATGRLRDDRRRNAGRLQRQVPRDGYGFDDVHLRGE
jgi:hypothetical protein